jgi:hypothetical protein
MVRFLVEQGVAEKVLWINPLPLRLPVMADLRKGGAVYDQQTPACGEIEVFDLFSLPLEPVPLLNRINDIFHCSAIQRLKAFARGEPVILGFGKPGRFPLFLLDRFGPVHSSFYDAMDDFPEFYSGIARKQVAKWEQRLACRVKRVLVSSSWLEKKFAGLKECPGPVLLRNACRPARFPAKGPVKDENRKVLGYIGSMGKWFDWELVMEIAEANSKCDIHLIGPVFVHAPSPLPANVTLFPPCRHSETPVYMRGFSAGLVPFVLDSLTRGVDPVKFYEYRSMGLPVISTPFGEMAGRGPGERVYLVERGNCRQGVEDALRARKDISDEETAKFVSANSWEMRFSPLPGLLAPERVS